MIAKTSKSATRMDQFPNFYRQTFFGVDNSITWTEWVTGYSIKDGYAFVLHKIKYRFAAANIGTLDVNADSLNAAISANNSLTLSDIAAGVNPSLLDSCRAFYKVATAVGMALSEFEFIHDFTNEPGGGRIIAPKPLFIGVGASALGQVPSCSIEIVYTMVKLNQEVYRELYESMNPNA